MKNKKGFTLVELLVVVSIVCLLSIVVIPLLTDKFNEGVNTYYSGLEKSISLAVSDYYSSNRSIVPQKNTVVVDTLYDFVKNDENLFSSQIFDSNGNICNYKESFIVTKNVDGKIEREVCLKCQDYVSDECENVYNYEDVKLVEDASFLIQGVPAEGEDVNPRIDVAMLIDVSGSMFTSTADSNANLLSNPMADVINTLAADNTGLIDSLLNYRYIDFNISITQVALNSNTNIYLSSNDGALKRVVNEELENDGLTDLGAGIEAAYQTFYRDGEGACLKSDAEGQCLTEYEGEDVNKNKKVIIILTDGYSNKGEGSSEDISRNIIEMVDSYKNEGVIFYIIGYYTNDTYKQFLQVL